MTSFTDATKIRRKTLRHSLTQSSSFLMEHIRSTYAHHLTLFWSLHFHPLPREHSCAPPCVLGSASLAFPLWVPLCYPFGYVWSLQCVVNPTPSSFSYLLLYWSLLCLSPELLTVYLSKLPNSQYVPHALIDEQMQVLLQSPSWLPSFRLSTWS